MMVIERLFKKCRMKIEVPVLVALMILPVAFSHPVKADPNAPVGNKSIIPLSPKDPGAGELQTPPKNRISVTRNTPNEPVADSFSAEKSIDFIERSVTRWQEQHGCVTCHTNGLHLVAGSSVTPDSQVLLDSREFARDYLAAAVNGQSKPSDQHVAIEGAVATSCFLAIGEMTTGKELHPKTAAALDYIWTQQSESGAWQDWLKCHWAPFEVDDHFGVSLAAIALAMTPDAYQQKPATTRARQRLRNYLTVNPPTSKHQKAMLLWASRYAPDLVTPDQKQQWIKELRALQQSDGGWVLIHLGDDSWQREDSEPQNQESDGYATAMVIFALRQAGIPKNNPAIKRGITWLKSHQRKSGRWFTHSPRRNGQHYITQAATNMALLALASCGELP